MKRDTLKEALYYLQSSLSVIPVGSDKRPLVKWSEYQTRFASEDEVKGWFKKFPQANIGIVTGEISNLCVIDADTDEGVQLIEDIIPEQLDTPIVETPSGGRHYYFRLPHGMTLKNKVRHLDGCDFRAEGGYVVAPPSIGGNGKPYLFARDIKNVKIAELPEAYIRHVNSVRETRASSPEDACNINITPYIGKQQNVTSFFSEGRRDNDLFSVAHALVKGGAETALVTHVAEKLALSCLPPFPVEQALIKVKSAFNYTADKKRSITAEVKEWFLQQDGYFSVTDAYFALQVQHDKNAMAAVRTALTRLCVKGILERHGSKAGTYRKIDNSAEVINFMAADVSPLNLLLPFEIEKKVRILPKNIIVVAGSSNAGKTAFMLNTVLMNMHVHDIHYFSSEMGKEELRDRLEQFDIPLDQWPFKAYERSSNFHDVIRPDAVNIIDFYELHDEFYKVGGGLMKIYERLDKGIAIIALQKKSGESVGRGGEFTLEKPRLYLAMDNGRIEIVKAKNWAQKGNNPNGLEANFKLVDGCRFIMTSDWHERNDQ